MNIFKDSDSYILSMSVVPAEIVANADTLWAESKELLFFEGTSDRARNDEQLKLN